MCLLNAVVCEDMEIANKYGQSEQTHKEGGPYHALVPEVQGRVQGRVYRLQ